jgi:hypothetical protein
MTGMAQVQEMEFGGFDYLDLKTVDPNYTPIEEDVYTLKVLKLTGAMTTGNNGKEKKPYVKGTFAVTNHNKHSARRLFHNFWNITENSSRDAKDLRKLADATGVPQEGSFSRWMESISQIQPVFKAPVQLKAKTTFNKDTNTRESVIENGEVVNENVIDFRNTQPA